MAGCGEGGDIKRSESEEKIKGGGKKNHCSMPLTVAYDTHRIYSPCLGVYGPEC